MTDKKDKDVVFRTRERALRFLREHPEEPPRTWRDFLAEGFAILSREAPVVTRKEIHEETQETMSRAWCKAVVQVTSQIIEEKGWSNEDAILKSSS